MMEPFFFNLWFLIFFLLRYVRLLVHLYSFWVLYSPSKVAERPRHTPDGVAVIIPTVDPLNPWFAQCIRSVAANGPLGIYVVTVGKSLQSIVSSALQPFVAEFPNVQFQFLYTRTANKRLQVAHVLLRIPDRCSIIALVDDTASWPSLRFLETAIAPFDDPKVGLVGTNKRVRRLDHGSGREGFWKGFWNFLGCMYLERHNFEIRATNAIDGGVFVVSGRTALMRREIVQDKVFLSKYTNERVLGFGPLAADDDNFVTRWMVKCGWDIKIQYCKDTLVEVSVDRTVWRRQPWSVYAVYLTSFVNFALFNDIWFLWAVRHTTWFFNTKHKALLYMALWIFATKLVKPFPYFVRNPKDLVYLPGMLLFGWYHSFIKLYALFTSFVYQWRGRNLAAFDTDNDNEEDSQNGAGATG